MTGVLVVRAMPQTDDVVGGTGNHFDPQELTELLDQQALQLRLQSVRLGFLARPELLAGRVDVVDPVEERLDARRRAPAEDIFDGCRASSGARHVNSRRKATPRSRHGGAPPAGPWARTGAPAQPGPGRDP